MKNRIDNVLNYYKENENCDPNVYEFINICDEFAEYINSAAPNYGIYIVNGVSGKDKYPNEYETLQSFIQLSKQIEEKIKNSDLENKELLFTICDNCYSNAVHYNRVPNLDLQASVSGVSLYIAQQKRDLKKGIISEFTYSNTEEFNRIKEKYNEAKDSGYFADTINEVKNNHLEIAELFENICNTYNPKYELNIDNEINNRGTNVPERVDNILKYYEENKDCDPNLYEYIELCSDYADFINIAAPKYGIYSVNGSSIEEGRKKYPLAAQTYDKFKILSNKVFDKLINNDLDITELSPLYQLTLGVYRSALTYGKYGDQTLRAKAASVSLYIAQGKRNVRNGVTDEFTYSNLAEMNNLNSECEKIDMSDSNANNYGAFKRVLEDINKDYGVTYSSENIERKTL
ncbi:MAG: hypothetical protein Q4E69_03170 [Bacilli bacterium]|nr:hypothetical protein [Bacilli bacterium]